MIFWQFIRRHGRAAMAEQPTQSNGTTPGRGLSAQDKEDGFFETGHSVWFLIEYQEDMSDFLDSYLGPANR